VPRLADDPAPLEAVWGHKHEPKRLTGEKLAERIVSVWARLKREEN